jgi:exonuclease SbcD
VRLLHFADLHLGIENYGTLDPTTGLSTRVHDFLRGFDRIVERAINERFDAVLFAGDACKNRDPSPTIQREFARRIGRLAKADIPVVLLIGNHDLPNTMQRAAPTEIYQTLEIPGVYVCRQMDLLVVPTRSGPLQVVTLPWLPRSLLLSRDDYRSLDDAELDRKLGEGVSNAIAQFVSELDPALPSVLVAHLSLQGATLGFEQSIMLGRDVTVDRDELHAPAFDYIALGHIHKHQVVGTKPPAVYAGSPERVDFGEEREDKGYVVVTIEQREDGARETRWEFVKLPARAFRTLRFDALGDEPLEQVTRDIENAAGEVLDAIVRCFVRVQTGREKSVPAQEVRRLLLAAGAAQVAHVVVESEVQNRARIPIPPGEALEAIKMLERWLELRDTDEALRGRVLAKGRELIARRQSEQGGGSYDG